MKRTLLIILGLAAIAIALVMWRWRGESEVETSSDSRSSAASSPRTARKRADPTTLRRASNRSEVTAIAPKGAAAKTELAVGDAIMSVDGIDVTGEHGEYVELLLAAPVGTRVLLGLARGVSVSVPLAPRASP